MKEPALVIIKPDAIAKGIVGNVLLKFAETKLEIIGMRVFTPSRKLVEEHYRGIKNKPFFKATVDFFLGKYHKRNKIIGIVYYGEKAVSVCRRIAGATNPEDAASNTIRGAYGRVTKNNIYENVVHVSSSKRETQREIKLWFDPDDMIRNIYKTKTTKLTDNKARVWA